mgnify:CR=1 FL=1
MSKVYTDSLTHYGVKGMHWGVRKTDGSWSTQSNPNVNVNSRKDVRRTVKEQGLRKITRKEYSEAANSLNLRRQQLIWDAAKKYPDEVLVSSLFQNEKQPTLRTGKDFAAKIESGEVWNSRYTTLWTHPNSKADVEFGREVASSYLIPKYVKDVQ